MKVLLKSFSGIAVPALVALLFVPVSSRAATAYDSYNLKTYVTVNEPVQVPGAILQPHVKYVFRRLFVDGDIQELRILNAKETRVIADFAAIRDFPRPADHRILAFYETEPGYVKTVEAWFNPTLPAGLRFIYPKRTMTEIAEHRVGAQPAEVQTAQFQESVSPAEAGTGTMAQNQQPEVQREKPAEVAPAQPSPEIPSSAQSNEQNNAGAQAEQTTQNGLPAELPKTAGELPLILLIGLLAMGVRAALPSR